MKVLSKNTNKPITHVIHIADTHVRTGDRVSARVDEYRHVFQNFVKEMEAMNAVKNGEALLVIAGDLFHHKGRLETEGAIMMYEWLNQLLNILPVLVICGNHDFRQEDPEYKDMIEMLVAPYQKSAHMYPLHYLDTTGIYLWENLVFGVVSVKDTLQAYNTCGILTDLPKYPDPNVVEESECPCKIAIFHGSISQSALPSGNQVSDYASGYPLEWFKGYDIAMLGDNHTQQIHKGLGDTLVWAYPGSLVQQDGGEPFLGHGYVLWDIQKKTGTLHHVHNDYGTLNVFRSKQDVVMVRLRPHHTVPLEKFAKMKEFPACPQIRVLGVQGDDIIIEQHLKTCKVKPSRVYLSKFISSNQAGSSHTPLEVSDDVEVDAEEDERTMEKQMTQLVDLNKPDVWKNFILQKAPHLGEDVIEWLYKPSSLLIQKDAVPDVLQDKFTNKNKILQQFIDIYDGKVEGIHQQRYNITLKHMEWEYLMCYGAENWFDFSQMDGKVALLNGKNASGKSSFIDVLCLAIFGDPTTMRSDIHGNKMSVKVIHDKKPTTSKHDSAFVKLLFDINSELYEIKRSFTVKQKDEVLQAKVNKIATIHRVVDQKTTLIADGTTMVNDWVAERFGSLPEILMSTILCQMDTSNFFMQKEGDQIRILEKALHMETIHEYEKVLHEAVKSYKYCVNEMTTYLQGVTDSTKTEGVSMEEIETALRQLEELKAEYKQYDGRRSELAKTSEELLLKIKGEVDTYGYDLEEAHEGFYKEQAVIDQYPDLTPEVCKEAHVLKTRLEERERTFQNQNLPRMNMNVGGGVEDDRDGDARDIKARLKNTEKAITMTLKKKPEEPHFTEAYIEKKEAEYNAWLNTIKYMEIDLRDLNHTMAVRLEQQNKLYQEQNELAKATFAITRPAAQYKKWVQEWSEWCEFAESVSEMTVEEMDQRAEEIRVYLGKIEEIRVEYRMLLNKMESAKSEYARYEGVEFNPHCDACQKNPMKQHKEALVRELKELEMKSKKLEKKLKSMEETEGDYKSELEDMKLSRSDRLKYELQAAKIQQEKAEWDKSAEEWKLKEEHTKKEQALLRDLKVIFQELQGLQKIKTEHDVWIKENQRLEKERVANEEWNAWNKAYQDLVDTKQFYQNTLDWEEFQNQKKKNAELFERMEVFEHAVKERDEWMNIILSIQWLKNKDEMDKVGGKCDELYSRLTILETQTQGTLGKIKLTQSYQQTLKKYQEKLKQLQEFTTVFVGEKGSSTNGGFKAWVYKTEIIPLIEKEVNQFIAPLDEFRLKIQYHDGALLYSLEDRGNNPTLDHASGYQRFLVGIAMRIALARIGAIGQNIRHLIIDEGFVACDSNNILKVDAILKSMMEIGNYKSVLLMSHLDMIRDIAQTRIHINRSEDNVFSKITWGAMYPKLEKYKKASDPPIGAIASGAGTETKPKKSRNTLKKIQ